MELNFAQKENLQKIEIIKEAYPLYIKQLLGNRGVKIQEDIDARRVVDWSALMHFNYPLTSQEELDYFNSVLSRVNFPMNDSVIMEFGYNWPISKLPIKLFVEQWERFVQAANYESVIIGSNFIMEFGKIPEMMVSSTINLEESA
jgi:hypothetical protein